jgi:hypothetical protein
MFSPNMTRRSLIATFPSEYYFGSEEIFDLYLHNNTSYHGTPPANLVDLTEI